MMIAMAYVLQCDMKSECVNPISHIGNKGYVYCVECAPLRKGWENCRKLRTWELKLIAAGERLPSYKPIPKSAYLKVV